MQGAVALANHVDFPATLAKIQLIVDGDPVIVAREPAPLLLGVGPSREHALDRRCKAALDDEVGVRNAPSTHVTLMSHRAPRPAAVPCDRSGLAKPGGAGPPSARW